VDFDLPRDLADWQLRVRAFVAAELSPHDAAIEKTGVIPPSALDGLRRMGLYGLNTPKHYGGLGLTMLGTCLALQELAKAHIAYYYVSGVNVHIGSKGIEFDGTEAQRRRWLPELASGRIVASFALTEPGAGSDAGGIATTALRDGGHYVLNGRKIYITNAPVAGLFTVFARTRSDNPRGAISALLVEAGTPGLEIGEATEMLAGNGSGHAEVIFRDCRIPAANLLGEAEGRGFATAMKCLDAGRVCWGAYCVGAAERLLELAVGHVTTRKQFGAPLSANQGIEWQIADMYASLHAARLVSREAAWSYDTKPQQRTARSALAKYVGADMVFRVADTTLQMFGGSGYAKSLPVERIWREVRVVRILDGTSEIMRKIIAREVLGQGDAG
jgi:acyl-CoA dehydrogenase